MTFEQAVAAMAAFEGRPVEVDLIATRMATQPDDETVPPGSAGLIVGEPMMGVVRRMQPWDVDEFWWTLPPDVWFALAPDQRLIFRKSHFRGGMWDGDSLILGFEAFVRRVVPLVRSDALQTLANLYAASVPPGDTIAANGGD